MTGLVGKLLRTKSTWILDFHESAALESQAVTKKHRMEDGAGH